MSYKLRANNKNISGEIKLTSSKSISNRLLIIQALCNENFAIENLSDSADTSTLCSILAKEKNIQSGEKTYDVGAAGTTMRFLTALFAIKPGVRILTGSDRMKKRPLRVLVNALKQLGAEIEYLESDGFPPIKITGKELKGGEIEVDGSISSQYISALLMIAPVLPLGMVIKFTGVITSRPYINMTLKVMETFGVTGMWDGDQVSVSPQRYTAPESKTFKVESDWSAASYWYAMAAFSDTADIILNGLHKQSIQGDAVLPDLFNFFGVRTEFVDNGIKITKAGVVTEFFGFDFNDCPDIAQTIGVVSSALDVPALCKGLSTLKIKETDRALALKNELAKINSDLQIKSDDAAFIVPGKITPPSSPIKTYDDHRMAMAFSTLVFKFGEIIIEEPSVVKKSYPDFWNHLRQIGVTIEE
jgi:3-phosphoshikimate 1-carboxyvinyltransferase